MRIEIFPGHFLTDDPPAEPGGLPVVVGPDGTAHDATAMVVVPYEHTRPGEPVGAACALGSVVVGWIRHGGGTQAQLDFALEFLRTPPAWSNPAIDAVLADDVDIDGLLN